MAKLKIRYGGSVSEFDDNSFAYNHQNFGTARLNFKHTKTQEVVSSDGSTVTQTVTSTGRFGLTTDPNASDYCKLNVRVGGQIARIGRVCSTSYIQSDSSTVTRGNSIIASTSESISESVDYFNTYSALKTSAAKPPIRVIENETGMTATVNSVTYKTAVDTWYTFPFADMYIARTRYYYTTWNLPAPATATKSKTMHYSVLYSDSPYVVNYMTMKFDKQTDATRQRYNVLTADMGGITSYTKSENYGLTYMATQTVTRTFATSKSASEANNTTQAWVNIGSTAWGSDNKQTSYSRRLSYTTRFSQSGTAKSIAAKTVTSRSDYKALYITRTIGNTAVSYDYDTYYSFTSSTASKRTLQTVSVSETLHNFDI